MFFNSLHFLIMDKTTMASSKHFKRMYLAQKRDNSFTFWIWLQMILELRLVCQLVVLLGLLV